MMVLGFEIEVGEGGAVLITLARPVINIREHGRRCPLGHCKTLYKDVPFAAAGA